MSAAESAARAMRERVQRICVDHGIPGVTAAVLADGDVAAFSIGVGDVRSQVSLTVDDRVPIASVSKVFTATVVVALAEDGLVDLDAPLAAQVPMPTEVAAGPAGRATPRQLLTHTSGIEGDVFLDPGNDAAAVERYVAQCGSVRSIHPPDAAASYCNTGMVLLSRLAEVALGCSWPDAVAQTLTGPAGVPGVHALDQSGSGSTVGHVGPAAARQPAPPRPFPRAVAAAGGMWASPSETLQLVRPHLSGGESAARRLGLSAEAVAEMQRDHVAIPGPAWLLCPQAWGLGWSTYAWDGGRVIGHDGGGTGTSSFLRAVPAAGVAVLLVANVGDCGPELGGAVAATVTELTGALPPEPIAPSAVALPIEAGLEPLAGWYVGSSESWLVSDRPNGLEVRLGAWDAAPSASAAPETLLPWDHSARRWVAPPQDAFRMATPVTFTELPDGRAAIHRFGRVAVAKEAWVS